MTRIVFKNLEPSDFIKKAVSQRIDFIKGKFPALSNCKIEVVLEMQNSPLQAGPDAFSVKVNVKGGKFRIFIEKQSSNIYAALARISDHLADIVNRYGDRSRVKGRSAQRKLVYS